MIIAGIYSFKDGEKYIGANFPSLFEEIKEIISDVDASKCKIKTSTPVANHASTMSRCRQEGSSSPLHQCENDPS